MEREYKEWEAKSLDISRKTAEYQKIKANVDRVQNLYQRLLDVMQTVGVGKQLDSESVVILERASAAVPTRGNVALQLALAAFVGLALGLGVLMLLDRFDDRLTSFTELQELFDEPVLGQVPLEKPAAGEAAIQLIQPNDLRHGFLEAYRNLRSSLLYMGINGKRPKTILVTGALPGDGKSLTVANLAITLARAKSRVLLVDADLRRGTLHKLFGVTNNSGLHEVLLQETDPAAAVVATAVPNLFLLPRGSVLNDPGELFLSQHLDRFIGESAGQYDYVIFDSAPVMAADDVTTLAPRMEGVIFVIRANSTSARIAHAALELLYQRKVNVLGLVFNAVDVRGAEYYYYKYKDYYAARPDA
jgi:capsular exopolysaccharide synthesis family protein